MVFVSNEVGEHSITTRDLSVNENTIIQFEVLVRRKLFCLFLHVLPRSALVYLPSCSDCQVETLIDLTLLSLMWMYRDAFNTQIRAISASKSSTFLLKLLLCPCLYTCTDSIKVHVLCIGESPLAGKRMSKIKWGSKWPLHSLLKVRVQCFPRLTSGELQLHLWQ